MTDQSDEQAREGAARELVAARTSFNIARRVLDTTTDAKLVTGHVADYLRAKAAMGEAELRAAKAFGITRPKRGK